MKKFLSLVLALVMTMSLVTIGAGAKDFDDSDDINYDVAVAVMSEVKVVEGYPDGSFNPSKTLTRAEAAKIICNMILGPTTASALKADTAPFSDVPTSHWAAGYIAYCSNQGTIKGYGDGKFGPSDTLTGYAFMKMLLTALGYDAGIEAYVGPNWSINVAKRALGIGLDKGLDEDFDGTKPVTREEACLYAFNTLQADLVKYANQSTISVGDITISTNSKAEPDSARSTDRANNVKVDGIPQFAERYFTKLVATPSRDKLARPITVWKYDKGDAINEVDTADAVYSSKPDHKDVYTDLGLSAGVQFYYYVNGVSSIFTTNRVDLTKAESGVGIEALGDGVNMEVFYDKDNAANNTFSIYYTYAGKVTKIGTNSDDNREATVSISNWANGSSLKVEDEVVEKNDIVQVNVGWTGSAYAIAKIEKVEKQTGTVTKVVGSDTYYINGEKLKINKVGDIGSVSAGDEVEYYLDSNGYILKMVKADSNDIADLAYVAASGNARGVNWAKLVLTDGTKKTVDLDDGESIATTFSPGSIVKFKTNKSGLVEHQTLNNYFYYGSTASNAYYLTKGVTEVKYDNGSAIVGTGIKLNGKTTIMVLDGTDVYLYTGVANIPALQATSITASWKNSDATTLPAQLVVVTAVTGSVVNSNAKLKLLGFKKSEDTVQVDDLAPYYEVLDIKTGETVSVKTAATGGISTAKDNIYVAKNYSTNSDKQISGLTRADDGKFYYTTSGTVKITGDTIDMTGAASVSTSGATLSRYINSDVEVYVLSKGLDKIADTWTLADLDDFEETIASSGYDYKQVLFTVDSDDYVDAIVLVLTK